MAEDTDKKMTEETPSAAPEEQAPLQAEAVTDETSAPAAKKATAEDAEAKQTSEETDAVAGKESSEDAQPRRGRGRRYIPAGIAHIKATFNNTQVAISDAHGNVISWSTAGRAGFKGSRKSTAFAATVVAQDAGRQATAKGMSEVEVRLQGAGSGRESAVRGLQSAGLTVSVIKDITPVPHNGCRPRKRRRV